MYDFLNEVAKYLQDQSVGIYTTDATRNIFVGKIPSKTVECIVLLGLPGNIPNDARQVNSLGWPRFQVFIRSESYDDASDLLTAVKTALHAKYGVILPHWRIMACHEDQEGGPIGQDEKGRFEFSINFTCEVNHETAA